MKRLLFVLLFISVTVYGQTYARYSINDWILQSIGTNQYSPYNIQANYTNGLVINVPENTIFKCFILSGNAGGSVDVKFPESTEKLYIGDSSDPQYFYSDIPILGPATVYFNGTFSRTGNVSNGLSTNNGLVCLIGQFTQVNVTPALQGYAVQPNGKTATVQLQTSTDLTTWQTATNGTYPATNQAAFYRLKMEVQ